MRFQSIGLIGLLYAGGSFAQMAVPSAPTSATMQPQNDSLPEFKQKIEQDVYDTVKRHDDHMRDVESQLWERFEKDLALWKTSVQRDVEDAKSYSSNALAYLTAILTVMGIVSVGITAIMSYITWAYDRTLKGLKEKTNSHLKFIENTATTVQAGLETSRSLLSDITKRQSEIEMKCSAFDKILEVRQAELQDLLNSGRQLQNAIKEQGTITIERIKNITLAFPVVSQNESSSEDNRLVAPIGHDDVLATMTNFARSSEAKKDFKNASFAWEIVLHNDSNNYQASFGLAYATSMLASVENDPARKAALSVDALKKWERVAQIDSRNARVWFNWGVALAEVSGITDKPDVRIQLIEEACAKLEEATTIDPLNADTFVYWATMLSVLALFETDPDKQRNIYDKSKQKSWKANAITPGIASYNLACIASIQGNIESCYKFIKESKEHGYLPKVSSLQNDVLLKNIQNEEWFKGLLADQEKLESDNKV